MSYKDEDFKKRDESNETDEVSEWEDNLELSDADEGDADNEAPDFADDDFSAEDDIDSSMESKSLEQALDAVLADAWTVAEEEGESSSSNAPSMGETDSADDAALNDLEDLSDESFRDPAKPILFRNPELTDALNAEFEESAIREEGSYEDSDEASTSVEDEEASKLPKFFQVIRDFFKPKTKEQQTSAAAAQDGNGSKPRAERAPQPDLSDQYFSEDDFIDLDELQPEEQAELDLEDASFEAEASETSDHAFTDFNASDPVNYPDYAAYAKKTDNEVKSSGGLLNRLSNAKVSTRVALVLTGLVLLFFIAISIWRATIPDPLRPTTMENTAELLRRSLYEQDFDAYRGLFKESHRPEILETDFRELTRIATSDASSSNYSILRMSNGRMLILGMEKDESSGEFRVLYVLEVPTAMKELFTDRTLGSGDENQLPIPLGQFPATQGTEDVTESFEAESKPKVDEALHDETHPLEEPLPFEQVGPRKPMTAEDEVKEALAPYESPFGPLKDEEEKLNEASRKETRKDSGDQARETSRKSN